MYQVSEKIKYEPHFKWQNKMGGNPLRRNQSLHCQYHQEQGIPPRTAELCGIIWRSLSEKKGYNSSCTSPTSRGTNQGRGSGERLFKAPIRHNQRHLHYSQENWLATFQGDVCNPVTYRGIKQNAEKGKNEGPTSVKLFG